MKKWWPHTISCVCNGVTVTIILLFFFYEIITDGAAFTFNDGLGVFVFLLGYTIYIIADIWGLKLYSRHKNLDSVSFTDKGKVQVLLFFLVLLQIFMGYVAYILIRKIIWDFQSGYEINNFWDILVYLILIVFFTALIVLFGYIFLLRAMNRNKKLVQEEIENIGKIDF
jgi:hypothetical protein